LILIDNRTKVIKISKGDYAPLQFNIQGYVLQQGDVIHFSVKKNVEDGTPLIYKEITNDGESFFIVTITEDDVADMDFDDYLYDVRLVYADGTIYTPIYPTLFRVMEVVGNG